jgi:energy-coupling factor transporter ATP-binding protein EcfA2
VRPTFSAARALPPHGGHNDDGKSTALRCINRIENWQRGRIIVDGTELTDNLKTIDEVRRIVTIGSEKLLPPPALPENRLELSRSKALTSPHRQDTADPPPHAPARQSVAFALSPGVASAPFDRPGSSCARGIRASSCGAGHSAEMFSS